MSSPCTTVFVFTGALSSITRAKAQQTIADVGGIIGGNVTKGTDFLIVGQQDYRVVSEDGLSSKQEKANKLIEKGSTLEIISEDDFLKNLWRTRRKAAANLGIAAMLAGCGNNEHFIAIMLLFRRHKHR